MQTVGDLLRSRREKKRFSIEDAHKFLKIHPQFLRALEDGDYSVFSDKVHAKGFLKIYAEFLDLDVGKILALWRREYEAIFDKKREEHSFEFRYLKPAKLILTPSLVVGVVAALLIILFFSYLFYQYRSYTGAPKLEIYTPQNSIVVHLDVLDVTGKTDIDSVLLINNQRVILNTDGTFATSIKLKQGLNTLSFVAIDKLGKETELTRTIIYRESNVIESTESVESIEKRP